MSAHIVALTEMFCISCSSFATHQTRSAPVLASLVRSVWINCAREHLNMDFDLDKTASWWPCGWTLCEDWMTNRHTAERIISRISAKWAKMTLHNRIQIPISFYCIYFGIQINYNRLKIPIPTKCIRIARGDIGERGVARPPNRWLYFVFHDLKFTQRQLN